MVSAVPSRVSLLISILRLNLVLTYGIPPELVYATLIEEDTYWESGRSTVRYIFYSKSISGRFIGFGLRF